MTGLIFHTRIEDGDQYDAYCYDDTEGPEKNCDKAFAENVPSDAPAEPSPQPEAQTQAEGKEEPETTPKPQPEDATESDGGHMTAAPEDGVVWEGEEPATPSASATTTEVVAEEPEDATKGLAVEENSFGRGKNSSVEPIFTPGDFDGSGSELHLSEEDKISPTAPVGGSEEIQPSIVNEPAVDNIEPDESANQPPNEKGRARAGVVPENNKDESGSSNWLVIIGVIVAVAAILLVCAAVAKRKSWCGRKQTLMITSKDGGEGNGAAASASSSHNQEREQEMVTLMNKEKIQENGNTEEFTVITLEESTDKEQLA